MKSFLLTYTFILAFIFIGAGCKSQKSNTVNETVVEKAEKSPEVISNDDPPVPKGDTCRLILSFYSIGEGTDFKAKQKMDEFVNKWTAEKGHKLPFDSRAWGREGEVDYCFKLNELSQEQQLEFVEGITEAIGDSSLVHITENQFFQHGQ